MSRRAVVFYDVAASPAEKRDALERGVAECLEELVEQHGFDREQLERCAEDGVEQAAQGVA